jgi:hypothetical protein
MDWDLNGTTAAGNLPFFCDVPYGAHTMLGGVVSTISMAVVREATLFWPPAPKMLA